MRDGPGIARDRVVLSRGRVHAISRGEVGFLEEDLVARIVVLVCGRVCHVLLVFLQGNDLAIGGEIALHSIVGVSAWR